MAKKTYAEMKEALSSQKEEAKQARKDLKDFCKAQKLELDKEYPDNKKWVKIKGLVDKTAKAVEETDKWLAENKDKKESKPRSTKYTYPPEVQTSADKKKYRAQQRAAANKKEKGETSEKPSKKKDKGEKAEKGEKSEKTAKKKKNKEEKAAAED